LSKPTHTSTSSRINVTLLREVLDWLTRNPTTHEQSVYITRLASWEAIEREVPEFACNTVGCLAGWTAIRSGYAPFMGPLRSSDESASTTGTTSLVSGPGLDTLINERMSSAYDLRHLPSEHDVYGADSVARELLGLTYPEAELLFHADNTILDLWKLAELFTDGRIVVPVRLRGTESQWDDDSWADFRGQFAGIPVMR
jgi:hypothetical protein